jgi:hypothetical protein
LEALIVAVALEFIDVVVPIALIRQKYPGGWEKCLADHANLIGGRVWYDEHLLRDGAMNGLDAQDLVRWWQRRGFEAFGVNTLGQRCWKDVCVIQGIFTGATLPCDWIDVDLERRIAWHRHWPVGETACRSRPVVGRELSNRG